jgi:rhodanese-related sulfurtransferase
VRQHRAVTVLDVRRAGEFGAVRIEGAVNVPLHELPGRMGEVPAGEVGGPDQQKHQALTQVPESQHPESTRVKHPLC